MNRLTKLALRLLGIRVKHRAPPPCNKMWSGSMDDYNKLAADGLLDSETFYAVFGTPPKTVPMSKAAIASMLNTVHVTKRHVLETHDPSASLGAFKDGVFVRNAIDVTTIDGQSLSPYHPQRSNTMLKFELSQGVKHKISHRTGVIYGRAEYVHQEPSYLVYWDAAPDQSKEMPNDWCGEGYLDTV